MNRRQVIGILAAGAGSFAVGALINYRSFSGGLWQNNKKTMLIVSEKASFELMKGLTKKYKSNRAEFRVENGSSLEAIIAVNLGSIDMALITRDLSDDEDTADTYNYLIARSSVSIIVNPANPVGGLTREQVHDLFVGKIKNWKGVGGADAPVNVMYRGRDSSTRQYFEENVLNGADYVSIANELTDAKSLSEAVANDVYAIGFIAAKDAKIVANVKRLDIDGVSASKATVLSGQYPFTSSFYLLISGDNDRDIKNNFIGFVRGAAGQKIIEELMPVC